jgi:N-dimethylarginine dimethylaminohydrolase
MNSENFSEYSVKPELIIVHDPTEFGAFGDFSSVPDDRALLSKFLFRAQPNVDALHAQHAGFVEVLRQNLTVTYLTDILGKSQLPSFRDYFIANANHMFTHDALITLPWIPDGYILANMKKPIRQTEPEVMRKIAELLELKEIMKMPPELYLEGGDVIPFCYDNKKVLLIGYGPRTSLESLYFLRQTLVKERMVDEIIGFKLADWRLNIDGCFFPVSRDLAVSHRESILGGIFLGADYSQEINPLAFFKMLGFAIIEATRDESYYMQACNFVCLGANRFVAYNITDRINAILRTHGLKINGVHGDQLVKGNGGPHCMTRPVYRKS